MPFIKELPIDYFARPSFCYNDVFLWQGDNVFVMDNHKSALWCWMQMCSPDEKYNFMHIAYGSLMEAQCQLDIAKDLGYITAEEFDMVDNAISEEGCIISGMKRILSQKLTTDTNTNH